MDKKIIAILLILTAIVSVACVSAIELKQPVQFEKFKINETGNDSFGDGTDDPYFSGKLFNANTTWANDNKTVFIMYYEDGMNNVLDYLKHNSVFTDNATTDGNLTVLENPVPEMTTDGYNITALAGVSSPDGSKVIFIGGNNLNLVKDYAKTVVFN